MYTSSKQKFNTFSDGVTPHIGENGHWWFGTTDSGVVAEAQDGTSFSGVREYYLATLATAVTNDKPDSPSFDPDKQDEDYLKANWKTSVADTGYGTKNNSDVTYKYLWNVEVIESTKADGSKEVDITNPELMSVYLGGRIPKQYISYYCAQASSDAPTASLQPGLGTNNNSIVVPADSPWTTSLKVENDQEDYLFEITFVEYQEKDEDGKNLFQKISGPTCIGHNSISPTFVSLDNDSELLVRNSSGTILGTLPEVTAKLYINGSVDSTKVITLSAPDAFTASGSLISTYASFEDNTLKIKGIPSGFESGDFTFSYSTYTKKFSLRVVDGEYDYDLIIDKTTINSSGAGGTFNVKVKKKQSGGAPVEITVPSNTLKLFVGDSSEAYDGTDPSIGAEAKWQFKYNRWHSTPIKISLKEKIGDDWFEWDTETVEFVVNGQSLKKLNTYSRTGLTEVQIRGTSDSEGYGEEGHIEWWWTQEKLVDGSLGPKYDNEHIIIGDTVYLTGVTSDSKLEYTIYGVCLAKSESYDSNGTESVPRPAVQLETTSFIMGGATGQIALAPTRYFTGEYQQGSVIPSSSNADFNRKPQTGEVFSNVCNYGKQMVTFKITGVTDTHWSAEVLYAVSLVGPEGEKGITLELTNDQATIFVGNSGTIDADLLKNATTTEVIVRAGNTPLTETEGLTYSWSTSGTGNTLNSTDTSSTYFIALGTDTATAVVTVSVNGTTLGSKTFVVSKSKEGPTGPSGQNYRLGISPNSYNVAYDYDGTCEATLSITKYEGTSVSGLTIGTDTGDGKDFRIKNVTNNSWVDNSKISLQATTTFQLIYKPGDKNIILDSETITIVRNGEKGASITGDAGNSAARVYYGDNTYRTIDYLTTNVPVINGSGNLINTWATTKPSGKSFIYSCDLIYNPNTGKYSDAEKPKLLEATPPTNTSISSEQWATFMTLTNGGESQDSFFDDAGHMYINASLINTDSLVVNKDFSVNVRSTGAPNLLAADDLIITAESWSQSSAREWTLTKSSQWSGAYINPRILEAGKTYLLTYCFNVASGTMTKIGGHMGGASQLGFKFYRNSGDVSPGTNSSIFENNGAGYTTPYSLLTSAHDNCSGLIYRVALLFTFNGNITSNDGIYIQPNRGVASDTITFNLWDVMLQEVNAIPENLNNLIYTYPRGVAVTAEDVVTSINASADGVAVRGDKINFSTANFVITDNSNNIMFQAIGGSQNPKSVVLDYARQYPATSWEQYAKAGHTETWTITPSKNTHINIGDIAYVVGTVNEAGTVNGVNIPVNTSVKAYGRVIKFDDSHIFFDTLGYEFGPNGSLTKTYNNTVVHPQVSLAGWTIDAHRMLGPIGSNGKPTFGIAPAAGHGCYAIWAGATTGDGTQENPYGPGANFILDHNGNVKIRGEITATSLDLTSNGVKIDAKTSISNLATVATSGKYNDLDGKPQSVADLGLDTSELIYKGDVTSTPKTDALGRSYNEISVPRGDGTNITYGVYDAGDYVCFGSVGDNNTYYVLDKEGLLTANNAVIYGDLHATSGYLQSVEIAETAPQGTNLLVSETNSKDYTGFYRGANWADRQDPPYDGYSIIGDHTSTGEIAGMPFETLWSDYSDPGDAWPHWKGTGESKYLRMIFTKEEGTGKEAYYRFSTPLNGSNINTTSPPSKWFEPGKKYRLSGKLSLQAYIGSGSSWQSSEHNIKSINFRSQASKGGQSGWYGGVNSILYSGPTTAMTVVDDGTALPHAFARKWNDPNFIDFAQEFTVESDAQAYYLSFQIYPKDPARTMGACLCLKDLRLEKIVVNGSINIDQGIILWDGTRGNGEIDSDRNLVFKAGKDGAYIRGHINATTGSLGGFELNQGELTSSNKKVVSSYSLRNATGATRNGISYWNWTIPSLDGVDKIHVYVGAGTGFSGVPSNSMYVGGKTLVQLNFKPDSLIQQLPATFEASGPFSADANGKYIMEIAQADLGSGGGDIEITYTTKTFSLTEQGISHLKITPIKETASRTAQLKPLYLDEFGRVCVI